MKRIALPLSLLIVAFWAMVQPAAILDFSAPFLDLRKAYTLLLGALALGWMGFSMLLALRPAWLERSLGGLDKLFRVHKWAGITSVLLVAAHWLLILSPRTLVSWGWITLPPRPPRAPHGHGDFSWVHQAKEMGEWGAWLMIALGIVALLRFVPYSWFRKLHKGFPVAFLIGAFHSIVLVPDELRFAPFGLLTMSVAVVGSIIALISLVGWVGRSRRHHGQVSSVATTEAGVLDLQVTPGADWPGHEAGQFALLTLDRREGPHPFTIVSDWKAGAPLRFGIKALGDFTRRLPERVKIGDAVTIEGPYGCFDFGDIAEPQVWVAGGIGIAPFIARLEWLAARGGAKGKVHFFYSARTAAEASFPKSLGELCRRAGVELHQRIDAVDGMIQYEEIGQHIRDAKGVWFCGPLRWGQSLQSALRRNFGLPAERFHRELFEFR